MSHIAARAATLCAAALKRNDLDATDPEAFIKAHAPSEIVCEYALWVTLPAEIEKRGRPPRTAGTVRPPVDLAPGAALATVTVTVEDLPRDTRRRDAEDADPRVTRSRVEILQNPNREYAALADAVGRAVDRAIQRRRTEVRIDAAALKRAAPVRRADAVEIGQRNVVRSSGHMFGWGDDAVIDYTALMAAIERRRVLGLPHYGAPGHESADESDDLIEFGDLVQAAREAAGGWIESDEEFLSVVRREYAVLRAQGAAR